MTAQQISDGLTISQYADANFTTPQADGNYFKFTTNPARPVEIYIVLDNGMQRTLGNGIEGTFTLVPTRHASAQQTIHIRAMGFDGKYLEAEKQVNVAIPKTLSPEMQLIVGDAGTKDWTWDNDARPDGGAWGNCGYAGADGETWSNGISSCWWGLDTRDASAIAGQSSQNRGDGDKYQGGAYMTFNEDGSMASFTQSGEQIAVGVFSITNYNTSRNPSSDGSQPAWSLGTLNTTAGSILWPYAINTGASTPTAFEIMQLDDNHLKLVYAAPGTGSWSESTWWAFKKK